jgi:hypothetical protein
MTASAFCSAPHSALPNRERSERKRDSAIGVILIILIIVMALGRF